MPITRTDTNETYKDGKLVASETVVVDVTADAVEYDLHTRARQAIVANRTFLSNSSPTGAQVAAQVRALTRQANALLRLGLLRDLLADEQID